MIKRIVLAAAVSACFAAPAFAEVSIGGSAEMDLFYRTNNTADGDGKFLEEIAITVNIDGSDKLDSGNTLKWRLAQKVATDWRFDSWGAREAWIGYAGDWGELRFGNQFSNVYLTEDWPYGWKGQGGLFAEPPVQGFASGITYASPNFSGFSFNLGYDLGAGGIDGAAFEVAGHYANGGLAIDAGYVSTIDATSGGAGGNHGYSLAYQDGTDIGHWMVGARYTFDNGFNVTGAFKRQFADRSEATAAGGWTSYDQDTYLIRGAYNFGKHGLALGYQMIADADTSGGDIDNGVQQIAFQWDYALSKNTGAFLQIRHNMLDGDKAVNNPNAGPFWYNLDGLSTVAGDSGNFVEDNSTRILIGTWTGF
ncbi:hypothetical protein GCM10007860_27750 [Chitiniphilus shinanonensis]|uniref:Porin domain-containing protein n=1 Tax=Chitiniphilus shinanonensis TaxID=553088 RepID=A0ABQ6BUE7_9NEIS|nr:porin [Chitiniphilus shinanonensis]GLS05618.1 hypothetical protein GCM10007860_27750 [Chitiniphilus shinanonensis]